MAFDIQGYHEKYKNFYGDAPLDEVAKDAFTRGGYDKEYPDYDTWKRSTGIESDIQSDLQKRTPKTWEDKLREGVTHAAPKQSDGNIIKSFLQGGAEGLTTELPSMVGEALEFTGSHLPFKGVENVGKSLKEWAEEKRQEIYGEEVERTGLDRIVYEGTKMLAPSLIPGGAVGTAARALKGVSALRKAGKLVEATKAARSATNIAGGSVAALFGLSQAQRTKETAEEGGVEPGVAPYVTGAIEAAGEFLGTKYLAKLFRLDEAEIVKRGAKEFVKDLIKTIGVETATETGQAGLEAGVEKVSGIRPEAKPIQEAIDVIGPTVFMTILTGGLAGATNKLRSDVQEERVAAQHIEKLKTGAMLSMTIDEGFKTGKVGEEAFTPVQAIELIKTATEGGVYSTDDVIRLKERYENKYPEFKKGLDDILNSAIKNDINYGIDAGLKAGEIRGKEFTPQNALDIIKDGHEKGLYNDADIDAFRDKYPALRQGLNDIVVDSAINKVNEALSQPVIDKTLDITEIAKPAEPSIDTKALNFARKVLPYYPAQKPTEADISILQEAKKLGRLDEGELKALNKITGIEKPAEIVQPEINKELPAPLSQTDAATVGKADEAKIGEPSIDYAAEAKKAGVTFNGMQESKTAPPMPVFTDPETKSTFMLNEGESIPDALSRKRQQFAAAKQPVIEPKIENKESIENFAKDTDIVLKTSETKEGLRQYLENKEGKQIFMDDAQADHFAKTRDKKFREALGITTAPEHLEFIMFDMKSAVEGGTPGGLQGKDAAGNDIYAGSGYPDWVGELVKKYSNKKTAPILTKQDKAPGIDAARIKVILTKGLKGDKLTPYQQVVWEDLNRIADRESTKSYAKQLEAFERVTKGEGYAEQIEQNAREAIAKYDPERYRGILGNYIAVGEVGLAKLGYDAKQIAQFRPYLEKIARDLRDTHARQIGVKETTTKEAATPNAIGEGKHVTPEVQAMLDESVAKAKSRTEAETDQRIRIRQAEKDIAEAKRLMEEAPETAELDSGIKTKSDYQKYIDEVQSWIDSKGKATPDSALIAEARKYKTAEEFAEAGEKYWDIAKYKRAINNNYRRLSADDFGGEKTIEVWRTGDKPIGVGDYVYGTKDEARHALSSGQGEKLFSKKIGVNELVQAGSPSGEYFYSPKRLAKYSDVKELWYEANHLENPFVKIRADKVKLALAESKKVASGAENWLKNKLDAVNSYMRDATDAQKINEVWSDSIAKDIFKTKAQLTDIWNKAQEGKAKEPWEQTKEEYNAQLKEETREKLITLKPLSAEFNVITKDLRVYGKWEVTPTNFNRFIFVGDKAIPEKGLSEQQISKLQDIAEGLTKELTGDVGRYDIKNNQITKTFKHGKLVEQALAEGKPVPAEVLKDYPELSPKTETTPAGKQVTIPGASEAETFSLANPETEISPKLSEQVKPKNAEMFAEDGKATKDETVKRATPGEKTPYILEEGTTNALPAHLSKPITDKESVGKAATIISGTIGRNIAPENLRLYERTGMDDLGKLGGAFQKKIMVFQVQGENLPELPGFFSPKDSSAIYLNTTTPDPHLTILGHELLHALKHDAPDIYKNFISHVQATEQLRESAKIYQEGYGGKASNSLLVEEYIAEYMGRRFTQKGFWNDLANQKPNIFKKVYDSFTKLVDKIKGIDFSSDMFFRDIKKAEQLSSKAMADYAERMRTKEGKDVLFSDKTRPGNVTIDTIKNHPRFQSATVTENKDGSAQVIFPNGDGFKVDFITDLADKGVRLETSYGNFRKVDKRVAGAYVEKNKTVLFNKDRAGIPTIDHEHIHFLEKSGYLDSRDIRILNLGAKRAGREMTEEGRAEFVAQAFEKRDAQVGMVKQVLQKISDFFDMVMNAVGHRTTGGVLRDIESGKIMEAKGEKGAAQILQTGQAFYSNRLPAKAILIKGGEQINIRDITNRRFMYNPQNNELVLGDTGVLKGKGVRSSHAEEFHNVGASGKYDDAIRGWLGTSKKYPNGIIHFAPDISKETFSKYPDIADQGLKTIEYFLKNGATGNTVIRNFVNMGEHKIKDVFPELLSQSDVSYSLQDTKGTKYEDVLASLKQFIPKETSAGKVNAMYDRTAAQRAAREAISFKNIKNGLLRSMVDVSGNLKREVLKKDATLGRQVVMDMELYSGASAKAAVLGEEAGLKIFKGFNSDQLEVLNRVIESRRIIDIDNYKPGIKHPEGLTGKEHAEYLASLERVNPGLYKDISGRADEYFKTMREQVNELLKEGILTKESAKALNEHEYSPRKFFQYLDPENSFNLGGRKITVPDSGIKALDEGSLKLLENNAERLMAEVITRTQARIFRNRASKSLYDFAEKVPDNGVVRLAKVIGTTKNGKPIYEDTPGGYEKAKVMINGQAKEMIMPWEMAQDWVKSDPLINQTLATVIGTVSGAKILRPIATGYNPAFALTNMARDIGLVWTATMEYSSHLPIATGQLIKDLIKVAPDVMRRKGRVRDYIDEGGGMTFMTYYGRFSGKGFVGEKLNSLGKIMGWIGETSEIWTRMALRERAIQNGASSKEASWIARRYIDFNQGGNVAKGIDVAIPYMNAAIQGTRGLMRGAKNNPAAFTYKMAQLGALSACLYLANYLTNPEAWESITDREKEANFIITTPIYFIDDKGQKKYYYMKIAKEQGHRVVTSLFDALMARQFEGKLPTKQMLMGLEDFLVIPGLPPTLTAGISYLMNKDTWTKEDIWRGPEGIEAKEEYYNRTHPFWVSLGQSIGLSPERMSNATGKIIPPNNPFVGLVGGGYKMVTGDLPQEIQDKSAAQFITEIPSVRRILATTNPYTPYRDILEDIKKESATQNFTQNRTFDDLTEKYLKTKDQKYADEMIAFAAKLPEYDQQRLARRFEYQRKLYQVPDRSWYINTLHLPPEAKAVVFWDRYSRSSKQEKDKMIEIANRVGGFKSERFIKKLKELASGHPPGVLPDDNV